MNEPIVSVDAGVVNGGKLEFYSLAEIRDWVKKEQDHWEWVQKILQNECGKKILNEWGAVLQKAEGALRNVSLTEEEKKRSYVAIRDKLKILYSDNKTPVSDSPLGIAIKGEREKNGSEATAVVFALFAGCAEDLLREMSGPLEAAKRFKATLDAGLSLELVSAYKQALEGAAKKFQDYAEEAKNEVEKFKDYVERETSFAGSVAYWEERSVEHLAAANKNWWIFLGWLAGMVVVFCVAVYLLGGGGICGWKPFGDVDMFKTPFFHTPFFYMLIAIAFTAIWVARLVSRNYLSHAHLAVETKERAVMTQAYLALLREGQGLSEKDRQIILLNIFRPTSTGIVKDDAGPPATLVELIAGKLSSR